MVWCHRWPQTVGMIFAVMLVCIQLSIFSILVGREVTIAPISLLSTVIYFYFFNWVGGEVTIAQISLLSAVSFLYILVGWGVTIAQVVQKCIGSCIFMFIPVYAHVDGTGFQPHVWPPPTVLAWAATAHGWLWRAAPQRAVWSSLRTDPRPALSAGRCPHLLQKWPGKTLWGGVGWGVSVNLHQCRWDAGVYLLQNWPGPPGWGGCVSESVSV